VPDHNAGSATAFAGADNVDAFHFGKHVYVESLADGDFAGRAAEFADEGLRFAACLGQRFDARLGALLRAFAVEFGNLTTTRAAGQTTRLVQETQLHGLVAVAFGGPQLQHVAGAGFNNRHRHRVAAFVKNLSHPDLTAEQSNSHRNLFCD
jgi:hypothetical protein